MRERVRKLIGTILLLVFIPAYALAVVTFAVALLPEAGTLTRLAYFIATGLFWVLPAAVIIRWMQKPLDPA
jgi:hypothetical protein